MYGVVKKNYKKMTEKYLMNLDFEKVMVLNEESDNGYDYYYFRKNLIADVSIEADVIEGRLTTFTNDPNFIVWDLQTLKELIAKNAHKKLRCS